MIPCLYRYFYCQCKFCFVFQKKNGRELKKLEEVINSKQSELDELLPEYLERKSTEENCQSMYVLFSFIDCFCNLEKRMLHWLSSVLNSKAAFEQTWA